MTTPPAEFTEQVKQALEHLYDFSTLQKLPLAQELAPINSRANETPGHHLRRELITAIESLSPGSRSSVQSPDARLYNLLQLRYIEGITVQEAANRMGLSARQAHRSLRKGEESVTAVLWMRGQELQKERASPPAATENGAARELSSVSSEVSLLESQLEAVDIRAILQEALKATAPLAQKRGVLFEVALPDSPVIVSVETAVSQQIFASLFSRVIGLAQKESLSLRLNQRQEQAVVTLSYLPEHESSPVIVDEVIEQFVKRLGWTIREEKVVNGRSAIVLNLTGQGALILVVDDNEGLVELLGRYLTGHNCRVLTATNGPEGLQLAQELIPDAIILDVMMPGASGWEILQTLRSQPQTATVPVIVCSVFNDPDLAYSLGATRFHAKPIRRDTILDTLHELGVV